MDQVFSRRIPLALGYLWLGLAMGLIIVGTPFPKAVVTWTSEAALRQHIEQLTKSPRTLGSPGHAAAQDYIRQKLEEVGLTVQREDSRLRLEAPVLSSVTAAVSNLSSRIEGRTDKLLMFSAHYDGVPATPGAGDNAVSVAILLELARYWQTLPRAERPGLLMLFTDAEEQGLLGATAFLKNSATAQDVGCVVVSDNRGTSGRPLAYLFGSKSGVLQRNFADNPAIYGNAAIASLLQYIPNGSDFYALGTRYDCGMGIGNIEHPLAYHGPGDTVEAIDYQEALTRAEYFRKLAAGFSGGLEASGSVYTIFPGLTINLSIMGSRSVVYIALLLALAWIVRSAMQARTRRQYRTQRGSWLLPWLMAGGVWVGFLVSYSGLLWLSHTLLTLLQPNFYREQYMNPPWDAALALSFALALAPWLLRALRAKGLALTIVLLAILSLTIWFLPDVSMLFSLPLHTWLFYALAKNYIKPRGLVLALGMLCLSLHLLFWGEMIHLVLLTLEVSLYALPVTAMLLILGVLWAEVFGWRPQRVRWGMLGMPLLVIFASVGYDRWRQLPLQDHLVLHYDQSEQRASLFAWSKDTCELLAKASQLGCGERSEPFVAPFQDSVHAIELGPLEAGSYTLTLSHQSAPDDPQTEDLTLSMPVPPELLRVVVRDTEQLLEVHQPDWNIEYRESELKAMSENGIIRFEQWNPGKESRWTVRWRGAKRPTLSFQAVYLHARERFPAWTPLAEFYPRWWDHRLIVSTKI